MTDMVCHVDQLVHPNVCKAGMQGIDSTLLLKTAKLTQTHQWAEHGLVSFVV